MKRLLPLSLLALILVGTGLFFFRGDNSGKKSQQKFDFSILEQIHEEGSEEGEKTGAHLAFLQNYEMTKDPDLGYPPVQRKVDAYAAMQVPLFERSAESAIPQVEWIERGADNVGGRTRAILFDPDDPESKAVWAGSTGGGLWYNTDITDEKSVWQHIPGLMDNLAISDVIYDPSNTNTMYVSTGLFFSGIAVGDGIFKSTDRGVTFSQLPASADRAFLATQDLMISQAGTLFAGTLRGLQRSTDGGETFTEVLQDEIADIEQATNGDIYVSTGFRATGRVFKSTDDGLTFENITPRANGERIEIGVAPSNPNVVYAVAEGGTGRSDVEWIVRSRDGGETWEDLPIPLDLSQDCTLGPDHFTRGQAFFDLILRVHPENEDIVIAGGISLHRSTNGGDDWTPVSYWTGLCDDLVHADQHAIEFRPGFPNEAVFGHDGGLSYSKNIGNADNPEFETRINGYNTTMLYGVAAVNEPGSNIFLAGLQDNGTIRYTEVGLGSGRDVSGGDGGLSFIDPNNPNIQLGSLVFNVVVRSDNGGRSFTAIANDQTAGRFINPADYDARSASYFSAGNSNQIRRIQGILGTPTAQETLNVTIDGGQISSIKVSPNVENRLFVGTGSGLMYRIDSTHRNVLVVTAINGTFEGNRGTFVSGIDIGATDDQIAITYSNFGRTSVYETTNGGQTWENKEGNLPDIPVRDILYNPDNREQVMIATELGVWSTTEFSSDSPTWEATNSGLASVRVDKLLYRPADKLVAAATHGRGLFTTTAFSDISIADFTANNTVGYAGVPVQFTDGATNAEGDYAWDFGDGNTSDQPSPSHVYDTPGTYTVSLSVNGGAATETRPDYITILPLRSLPYTLADGGDFETDNGDFFAESILHGVDLWERGTPTGILNEPSSGTNVWKTGLSTLVENPGFDGKSALYTPAFDLTDPTRDYTLKFRRSGSTGAPIGPIALYVQFSIDGGTEWFTLGSSLDEFGQVNWYDRGPNLEFFLVNDLNEDQMGWSETANNPVFNVDTQVKLNQFIGTPNIAFRFVTAVSSRFTGGYSVDGYMIDDFEITADEPTADFAAERTVVAENGTIDFTYTSNGAETFSWDFGDGGTSTEENPSHVYTQAGVYTVSLTITSDGNSVTETQEDLITVLSTVSTPYLLADGGNFEVNQDQFVAENITGTPFELGMSSITGKNGTSSGDFAWVTGIDENLYQANSEAFLYTPSFDFSQSLEYTLEFRANFDYEDNFDGFIVEYSTDFGQTFTKLNNNVEEGWYNQTADPTAIFGPEAPIFSGDTGGEFETFSTDVGFLFPNESVVFRFVFLTDPNVEAPGGAIDDFQIITATPAPPVAEFTFTDPSGCTGQIITFTNASTGTVSNFEWDFGANATPATATGEGPHTVVYSGTGFSSPSLTVSNIFNASDTETKPDAISSNPTHIPTITEQPATMPEQVPLRASDGDSYQWFRDGQLLEGETNQTLIATVSGFYSAAVTVDNCTVRSAAINLRVLITSIEDDSFAASVNAFPNPVRNELSITIANEVRGNHRFNFYSNDGRLIKIENREKNERDETFTFDVSTIPQGNFLIQIQSPEGTATKKIIKR